MKGGEGGREGRRRAGKGWGGREKEQLGEENEEEEQ